MTAKKQRQPKKQHANKKAHDKKAKKTEEADETPIWQKNGKPGQAKRGFQSQPRNVGKRYWRM